MGSILKSRLYKDSFGIYVIYVPNEKEFDCLTISIKYFRILQEGFEDVSVVHGKDIYNLWENHSHILTNGLNIDFTPLYSTIGTKHTVEGVLIEDEIKNSKSNNLIMSCIRGITDTDFTLTTRKGYYPVIRGTFSSKKLVISLKKLFDDLKVQSSFKLDIKKFDKRTNKIYIQNQISVNGFKRVYYFLRLIKPNNPKYSLKWKRYSQIYLSRMKINVPGEI